MKQLVLFSATVALVAAFIPTSALAKGATEAKITGPGLGNGITLAGEGQVGGTQLMQRQLEPERAPACAKAVEQRKRTVVGRDARDPCAVHVKQRGAIQHATSPAEISTGM